MLTVLPTTASCFTLLYNCCWWSTDKWRRWFNAVEGLDWPLTCLMWLVQTYLDRQTIFHINRLNLATSCKIDRENGYENRSSVYCHGWCLLVGAWCVYGSQLCVVGAWCVYVSQLCVVGAWCVYVSQGHSCVRELRSLVQLQQNKIESLEAEASELKLLHNELKREVVLLKVCCWACM